MTTTDYTDSLRQGQVAPDSNRGCSKIPIAPTFMRLYCFGHQNVPDANSVMKLHEPRSGQPEEPADDSTSEATGRAEEIRMEKGLAAEPQHAPAVQPSRIPPILLEGDQPPPPQPQKFTPSEEWPVTKPHAGGAALPEAYGTGRLWLAAPEPHCLYAHWDLSSQQRWHYASQAADRVLTIRIYQEDRPGQPITQIPVPPESKHSFIHVDLGGTGYVAELGYYASEQAWKPLMVSEPVTAPVDKVAEATAIEFATHRLQPALMGSPGETATPATGPSTRTVPVPEPVRADLPAFLGQAGVVARSPQFQGDEESMHYYAKLAGGLGPEFQLQLAQELPMHSREWTVAHDRALAELVGWSLAPHGVSGSAEISEIVRGRLESSSPGGGELPKPEGFWFNLNAELIIYGSTDPSAKVTLGGRTVELRPDGSFSLRVALPDGQHVFSATAYSAKGEVRRAELDVGRATRYYQEPGGPAPRPSG